MSWEGDNVGGEGFRETSRAWNGGAQGSRATRYETGPEAHSSRARSASCTRLSAASFW